MNGIHDMGGMHGLGPVEYEHDEPVFHAEWEGRVCAIRRAVAEWGRWTLDHTRDEIEHIPPGEYIRMSYYERWLVSTIELAIKAGLITPEELESGKPAAGSIRATPVLTADAAARAMVRPAAARPDAGVKPQFKPGERVRARNVHPTGHTRIPRYVRGKSGTIHMDHGTYVFPDAVVAGFGEKPQHVYSVRFESQELWGPAASRRDSVYVDLWDDYLERI
jgi:nitrile hydratase subunit beta